MQSTAGGICLILLILGGQESGLSGTAWLDVVSTISTAMVCVFTAFVCFSPCSRVFNYQIFKHWSRGGLGELLPFGVARAGQSVRSPNFADENHVTPKTAKILK